MRDASTSFRGPLRILAQRDRGAVGSGELVAVLSRAGVGKSTLLVGIALDLMAVGVDVLHVTTGHSLGDVEEGYRRAPAPAGAPLPGRRWIQAYPDDRELPGRVAGAIEGVCAHAGFVPGAILIDEMALDGPDPVRRGELEALKALATGKNASLWIAVRTHRSDTGAHPTTLPRSCEGHEDLIDLALYLEPREDHTALRILCDGCGGKGASLELGADLLWPRDELERGEGRPVLLSGGAEGAEECFGECAEEWGLEEVTYSFAGQILKRQRGLVELSEAELARGDVSAAYLSHTLQREFHSEERLRKVIQALWHEVASADEVFVVGTIEEAGTVRGGTGWAAELARHWKKPLFVFDETRRDWFAWREGEWRPEDLPRVRGRRFAGTGTRRLDEAGREAIRALFLRSFGPPKG